MPDKHDLNITEIIAIKVSEEHDGAFRCCRRAFGFFALSGHSFPFAYAVVGTLVFAVAPACIWLHRSSSKF